MDGQNLQTGLACCSKKTLSSQGVIGFHLPFLAVPEKHTVSSGVGLNGEASVKIPHISWGKVPTTQLSRTDNSKQDEEDGATARVLQHYTDFPRLHNFDPMS